MNAILHTSKRRNTKLLFWISVICLTIGAIIRVAYCIKYPVQPRDAYKYMGLIEEWEDTGGIGERLSFYPLSLWILKSPRHFFHRDLLKSGIALNITISLLLLLLIVYTSYKIFNNLYTSLIIGLIAATHPTLVHFSCSFLRENIYLFFSFLTLSFLGAYCMKPRLICITAAGLFGALAFLCRVEGIEVFVLFSIILLWKYWKDRGPLLKYVSHIVLFSVCFILCFALVCHLLNFELLPVDILFNKMNLDMLD